MSSRHHAQVPVFHQDHPHNRYPSPLPLAPANPNLPLGMQRMGSGKYRADVDMSDSDASRESSPEGKKRCFCGRSIEKSGEGERGIYCSITCARSDAFSSLCYRPEPHRVNSVASSASLSRNPSSASTATSSSGTYEATIPEWSASHYRRLAHAEGRKEERKEERRRRRAEGSFASTATSTTSRSTAMSTLSSSSRVPDLVSSHSHSRNPSVASSVSSTWSNLSRNPSTASSASASSRRYGGGGGNNVNVDAVIMEADDEEEWLAGTGPTYDTHPYAKKGHKRGVSGGTSKSRKKLEGALGMGKDMRDVLEEILQMEKVFIVDEQDPSDLDTPPLTLVAPYTAAFDRPPRTPSPPAGERERRQSRAPNAPKVAHRPTLSNASPPRVLPPGKRVARPPSLIGLHQSSLSESHTALYLATASPERSERRSASPKLQARESIMFTPDAAPPISNLPHAGPNASVNITPSRRRMNFAPAHHPNMDAWRFPAASGFGLAQPPAPAAPPASAPMDGATPTRANSHRTPPAKSNRPLAPGAPLPTMADRVQPHLLWPPPPNLQPSLFPSSPAENTPEVFTHSRARAFTSPSNAGSSPEVILPPNSGLRLGELLGSGAGAEEDVDMDDDTSTAHGHGGTYLPVFLEAEGFPSPRKW